MAGGTNGIYVMIDLTGPVRLEVQDIQRRYDPRLAREASPHVTLIGSSGVGPIDPSEPVARITATVRAVAEKHRPFTVPFGPPTRLGERTVVALPLDPHGPIRTLHEALRTCSLPTAASRWPFTPHCTLSFYPELDRPTLKAIMALRVKHDLPVSSLRVFHTRVGYPPLVLADIPLGAPAAPTATHPG